MVPHEAEHPPFSYELADELANLRAHKAKRGVPDKSSGALLAATWNLTNLGLQKRTPDDLRLMAEICSWFDLVAIQEIADDLTQLRALMSHLPASFRVIVSDIGGNDERTGFLYDSAKVERLELAAEVAVPPSDHRHIQLRGVSGCFHGFDRNPYVVAFRAGSLTFTAVSAHLYFGSHSFKDEDRRALEVYALARWASQQVKSSYAFSNNVLVMGDLNLPKKDDFQCRLTDRTSKMASWPSIEGAGHDPDRFHKTIFEHA